MPASEPRAIPRATDAPHDLAMRALLQQLAHELCALQLMVQAMEGSVDAMIARHAGVLDARSIQNLQLLDILNQTLLALATCAGTAAALAPPGWTLDGKAATAGITLASLAQRLGKGTGSATAPCTDAYELFSDG
jgi:hypothetical protein